MFAARHSYDASLSRVVVVSVTFDVVTKPICNRNIQFDALNQDIGPDIVFITDMKLRLMSALVATG